MIRYLIVTSDLTYVPNNYYDAIHSLIKSSNSLPVGFCFIRVPKVKSALTAFKLFLAGCPRFFFHFFKNLLLLPFDSRKSLARKKNIPILEIKDINSYQSLSLLKSLNLDIILNMRTRSIYSNDLLKIPKLGCINVHHGILPEQRGTLCDLYALSEGQRPGFSIHQMSEKIDDGKIISTFRSDYKGKHFFDYLKLIGEKEGQEVAKIINETERLFKLPEGYENASENIQYFKTPGYKTIKNIIAKGLKL